MKKLIKKILMSIISMLKWEKKIPIVSIKESRYLLEGKVALITGGSGGIGMAIAKKFLESGCKVIIAGTNSEKLDKCVSTLNGGGCPRTPNRNSENLQFESIAEVSCLSQGKKGPFEELQNSSTGMDAYKLKDEKSEIGALGRAGGVKSIVINMNDSASFNSKIADAVGCFGKIDIFVNCHGVHTNRKGFNLFNVSEQDYDKVMDINLRGTYFICQSIAKYMVENKVKGHILIVSSQSAIEPSWSPYRLSKYGECGLISGFAHVLRPYGIVVNGLGSGPTATDMQDECFKGSIYTPDNPIERYTLPDEVAEYAKMLVSDLGNTIIGDTLYMSGGRGIIDKR